MTDADIRRLLRQEYIERLHAEDTSTIVIDEMDVCEGEARVDIATINGFLSGIEIKSSHDNLQRLPRQSELYSRVFDRVAVVLAEEHVERALPIIPDWWGVMTVHSAGHSASLSTIREGQPNPSPDPLSIVSLLWRDEALALLSSCGMDKGYRSKPKRVLWQHIADVLELKQIQEAVRCALKAREGWRLDPQ